MLLDKSRHGASQFLAVSTIMAVVLGARVASAQLELAYSFEDGLQGFGPNGIGITVTQDTIGATDGTQSMRVDIVQPATFVGALTAELEPFVGDPPGIEVVQFDLTIEEAFPDEGFVQAGITIFGSTQPDFPGGQMDGLQAQFFENEIPLGDLEVGTHALEIELSAAVHPVTFVTGTFNEIFGTQGSGANELVPTGFQIYINKSSNSPWTGYIDNIRVGTPGSGPDPNGGDYNGDGVVNSTDYAVWRENLGGGPAGDGTTTGDLLGVPDGTVDVWDFDYWQQEYGAVIPAASVIAAPEPTTSALLAFLLVFGVPLRNTST